MEIIKRLLPRNGVVIDTGDWHFGALCCHHQGIRDMVQRCIDINKKKNQNCYMILKGDLMETIAPSDKRFNFHDRDLNMKTTGDQRNAIIEVLKPIKKYILALGIGNHELKDQNTEKHGEHICQELGTPYGAYNFVIEFRDKATGKLMFKTFHSHGNGSLKSAAKDLLQREANRKASLKQKLIKTRISDCIYMSMGHTHQLLVVHPNYQTEGLLTTSANGVHSHEIPETNQTSKNIPPDHRYYANTGSFLKLYAPNKSGVTTYGEMAMLEPADLGWVEFEFKDGRIIDVRKVKI